MMRDIICISFNLIINELQLSLKRMREKRILLNIGKMNNKMEIRRKNILLIVDK